MSKRRWWVNLRQSSNRFKVDTRSVIAPDLAAAEGIAQRLLRIYRLTKVDGDAWDCWQVKTSGSPHAVPTLVAYGDHVHTVYTARCHGWVD